jgi:threonine dehydrogenase-like Zn-dependent dehydrogenase
MNVSADHTSPSDGQRPGQPAGRVASVLLDEDLTLRLGSRVLAAPVPGQALVRVEWAGVCGSDLHVLRTGAWVSGWPATLGHEVAGVVEACPGGELPPGSLVVVDSRVPCRECDGCASALNLCYRLAWLGEACPGGFASHLVVPAAGLVSCPPGLEPSLAVLAEPLAVAMHAVGKLPRPASRVLVIGYGPVGALVHLEITRRWPRAVVAVTEPDPLRRQLASAFGADVAAIPDRVRWPVVVDAAGYPGSLAEAVSVAANGGMVLAVALGHEPVQIVPAGLVERALTVTGSIGFDAELPEAVAALADDPGRWRPLITEAVLLEDAVGRLQQLTGAPGPGKVVIRP